MTSNKIFVNSIAYFKKNNSDYILVSGSSKYLDIFDLKEISPKKIIGTLYKKNFNSKIM